MIINFKIYSYYYYYLNSYNNILLLICVLIYYYIYLKNLLNFIYNFSIEKIFKS